MQTKTPAFRCPPHPLITMKKTLHLLSAALLSLAPLAFTAEPPAVDESKSVLRATNHASDVRDLLALYASLTQRKVWLALGVHPGSVVLSIDQPTPKAEALTFLRRALLEQAGLAIRESGSDAFVEYTTDPAYQPAVEKSKSVPFAGAPATPRPWRARPRPPAPFEKN